MGGVADDVVRHRDQHDVQADDNQSTNGEIGNESPFDVVEDLAAIQYTKEE